MQKQQLLITALTGLLVCPLGAEQPENTASLALETILDLRRPLGLDEQTTFKTRTTFPDPLLGGTDVRVVQYFRGVRVLGGEAILHLRKGRLRAFTNGLKSGFTLACSPSLTGSEAVAIAVADLAPMGPLSRPAGCELVVARMKLGPGVPALRDALLYRVHTELEHGTLETRHTDYLIDAQTGAIAKRWDSLETLQAVAQGRSQYSGTVTLNDESTASGYQLRDPTRGSGGNTVKDVDHDSADGGGQIYASSLNHWGDGGNYTGGATTGVNGQTAAVDAAYGLQWTWDYYRNIHHRDGIDGSGTATTLRVHYGTGYDNAFWSDDCFCMTFGDGTKFKSLEAMDVIGHEVSHGVCSATANLDYFGESGGLNEANSDIHGTMVEFYSHSGDRSRIGDQGGNWLMGEQLETPAHPKPIRYLYKPSKDGKSPDAWDENLADLDVHLSSGPMNRCFYFLSQGASADPASDFHTTYLPKGMAGVGNDASARIRYRAMTSYMTSGADYAEARTDSIHAAKDLYGPGSAEERAVWNAFHGINVGPPWPETIN